VPPVTAGVREVISVAEGKQSRVPARPCVFCGSTAGITDEHVWPKWLRAHATDVTPERYTHTSGFGRTAADAFTEAPTVLLRQPGPVFNIRARAVCRKCNGGWMNVLEQRAKPLLLNMTASGRRDSLITLRPDQATTVASWAIKTSWMREESEPGRRATTQEMRQTLHRSGIPPKYSKVWAAKHDGRLDFNIKQAIVDVARHDRPWDTMDFRHVLRTCLTFLGISLLAYTVDGWGVPEPRHDLFRWVQLWPASSNVTFPPIATASDQDILIAAVRHPNLELPAVPRFVRDPNGPQQRRRN
jgi:hypothetical protein